jgi:hemoglobin/transferrin/lactoferrin receptor protein
VGGSLKEFGDLQGGHDVRRQAQTGYSEWDLDAKVDYFVTPASQLVYGHQTVRLDDAWRTHSTIYGVVWRGTTRGTDLQRRLDDARDLDYLQYHAAQLPGFAEEVHFSLSHQYQGDLEDRVRAAGNRERQSLDVHTLGVWLTLQSPSTVGRWVYGVDYYRDWVDSSYQGFDAAGNPTLPHWQGSVADDATYDLVGVFVENQLPLVEDCVGLILGGRFTHAAADADRIQDPHSRARLSVSDSWDNVVGNARLSYQPGAAKHWTLYGGASQGFRAPSLADLSRFDIARTGEYEIPALRLDPESFLSLELGVKREDARFAAQAAYFYTFIEDMIVRVPTGATTPNGEVIVYRENAGAGYVHGVELSGSLKLHRDWTLWANFTWMRGELDTPLVAGGAQVTEPVSRLMPTTLHSGLRWLHPNRRVWAEFAASFAGEQDRLASNDRRDTERIPVDGTPGYGVCHLRAGWNPCRYTTLTAALENLTDEDYRVHGSGLNEPGRAFILMAEFRF